MGLSWNSWYNPLDNVASAAKAIVGPKDVIPGINPFAAATGKGPYDGAMHYDDNTGVLSQASGGQWSPVSRHPVGNAYDESGSYGGGGGSYSSGPTYDPQQAALFDQAIANAESGINRLGTQEQIGRTNISDSYNSALNKLRGSKAIADRDYQQNKDDSTRDNVSARSTIDFNTGRQANSLQRLLGSRGSGRSTAATTAAPYAAALQGTQQRRGVTDAFGKNMQALDTSYGDFNVNYDSSVQDAGQQKERSERELQGGILEKRNSLLSTIAQLRAQKEQLIGGNAAASAQPYLDQINQNNNQIDQLGYQFSNRVNVQSPVYKTPELAQYNFDRPAPAQFGQGSALTGSINPSYLSVLLGGKRKEQQPSF